MRAKQLTIIVANSLFNGDCLFESYASMVKNKTRDASFMNRMEQVFVQKGRRWRKKQKMAVLNNNAKFTQNASIAVDCERNKAVASRIKQRVKEQRIKEEKIKSL